MTGVRLNNKLVASVHENEKFISKLDAFWVIMFAVVGTFINYIPYSNNLSTILQLILAGVVIVFNIRRPMMMIVAYILLHILPSRMTGGFTENIVQYYTLNARICTIIAIVLLFLNVFLSRGKNEIKVNATNSLWLVSFAIFIIMSYSWTISFTYYNYEFWFLCVAYLLFPLFIKSEKDIRLILFSYFLYTCITSVSIFPTIIAKDLVRGIVMLDPNYASFSILLGSVCALILLIRYKSQINKLLRIVFVVATVFNVAVIAFFASKTAFLCLIILIITFLIINRTKTSTIGLALIISSVSYFILNILHYFDTLFSRFDTSFIGTASGRTIIWQCLLDSFGRFNIFRMVFGNGYLTTEFFGVGAQAHNTYISILIGFGLIGVVLFVGYQINSLYKIISQKNTIFLLLFVCLMVYNFSLEPYLLKEGIVFFSLLGATGNLKSETNLRGEGEIIA